MARKLYQGRLRPVSTLAKTVQRLPKVLRVFWIVFALPICFITGILLSMLVANLVNPFR